MRFQLVLRPPPPPPPPPGGLLGVSRTTLPTGALTLVTVPSGAYLWAKAEALGLPGLGSPESDTTASRPEPLIP